MHDDDPDDVVHNLFAEQAWGSDSPLGRPIAGSVASIEALTRSPDHALLPPPLPRRQHGRLGRRQPRPRGRGARGEGVLRAQRLPLRRRCPGPGARAAPGAARLAGTGRGEPPVRAGQPRARHEGPAPQRRPALRARECSTPLWAEARRAACSRRCANAAAWPTRSSRSPPTTPTPASWASRSGACPASSTTCSSTVRIELSRVAAHGITEAELERGKGQLRGGLVLGLEDSGSRMSRLGKAELVYDDLLGIDEVIARIDERHPRGRAGHRGRGLRPARDPRHRRPGVAPPSRRKVRSEHRRVGAKSGVTRRLAPN